MFYKLAATMANMVQDLTFTVSHINLMRERRVKSNFAPKLFAWGCDTNAYWVKAILGTCCRVEWVLRPWNHHSCWLPSVSNHQLHDALQGNIILSALRPIHWGSNCTSSLFLSQLCTEVTWFIKFEKQNVPVNNLGRRMPVQRQFNVGLMLD